MQKRLRKLGRVSDCQDNPPIVQVRMHILEKSIDSTSHLQPEIKEHFLRIEANNLK